MREFKKRRSHKDEIASFVLTCTKTVILLVVTVLLMRGAWGMYGKMSAASQAQETAQVQLARVQMQRSGVTTTLTEITSKRGIEQQIRERYGVVRPGEGEIVVIHTIAASTTPVAFENTWWQKIFHALFVW